MAHSFFFPLMAIAEILSHSELGCSTNFNKQSGQPSCSPKQCKMNIQPTCGEEPFDGDGSTAPPPPQPVESLDHAAWLSQLECKECTQSRQGICMRLSTHFRTAAGHVKAAFCNDDFLVVHSDGLPEATLALDSIPQPAIGPDSPSGNTSGCRIRSAVEKVHFFKVPLRPERADDPAENTVPFPLSVQRSINMPGEGAIGVALDGVPLLTNYNRNGIYTWTSCELDACNGHVHSGRGYHYHGDPFGPDCLYSEEDYIGVGHPPLIGWSLDGFAIHGRYLSKASAAYGVLMPLDACGGHRHELEGIDAYGNATYDETYHYHSSVETGLSDTLEGTSGGPYLYNAFKLAPNQCWGGRISSIPGFWDRGGGSTAAIERESRSTSVAGADPWSALREAVDYEQMRPCCEMEHYFVQSALNANLPPAPPESQGASVLHGAGENAPHPPSSPPTPLPPALPAPPFPPPDLTLTYLGYGSAIGCGLSLLCCLGFCAYLYRRYDGTDAWRGGLDNGAYVLGLKWMRLEVRPLIFGLKWVAAEEPQLAELSEFKHEKLAEALSKHQEFTEEEWAKLKVAGLTEKHYVRSRGKGGYSEPFLPLPAEGVELKNPALTRALASGKLKLDQAEFDKLGLVQLTAESWIRAYHKKEMRKGKAIVIVREERYYRPAPPPAPAGPAFQLSGSSTCIRSAASASAGAAPTFTPPRGRGRAQAADERKEKEWRRQQQQMESPQRPPLNDQQRERRHQHTLSQPPQKQQQQQQQLHHLKQQQLGLEKLYQQQHHQHHQHHHPDQQQPDQYQDQQLYSGQHHRHVERRPPPPSAVAAGDAILANWRRGPPHGHQHDADDGSLPSAIAAGAAILANWRRGPPHGHQHDVERGYDLRGHQQEARDYHQTPAPRPRTKYHESPYRGMKAPIRV